MLVSRGAPSITGWMEDSVVMITGAKVFSATRAKEREELGETITRWLKANSQVEIVDKIVTQSSDREFHCVTVTFFFRERVAEAS